MSKNEMYREKLRQLIPGGSHTYSKGDDQWPANAPAVIKNGLGAEVWDADGNRFIDWSLGLTSVCLGHAHKEINEAAIQAMSIGHNFQRPSTIEADAAEAFLSFLDNKGDMVKFAKNGSTLTTAAVKLSRAFTRRDLVGICSDHPFFSYDDWFIGSTKCPDGIPQSNRSLTVGFRFNDIKSLELMFQANKGQVACLILEPMKFQRPLPGFLDAVYELCQKEGTLLILDEMVTGFKWSTQGASGYFEAKADLYTWGKGMANGHSVCALTGKREVMELGGIHHDKPRVFLASTTHGAEIPQLAAMMKTLEVFKRDEGLIARNWQKGAGLRKQLNEIVENAGLNEAISFVGDDCFFIADFKGKNGKTPSEGKTFLLQELVRRGQLFQGLFYPTPAHTDELIDETLAAWPQALERLRDFYEGRADARLIGEAIRPVFRAFNSCRCLSPDDCRKCQLKLS